MSITVSVDNPKNLDEEEFELPLCTEKLYRDIIYPAAKSINSKIIIRFGTFVDIKRKEQQELFTEMDLVLSEIKRDERNTQEDVKLVSARFEFAKNEIARLSEENPDVELCIG